LGDRLYLAVQRLSPGDGDGSAKRNASVAILNIFRFVATNNVHL